MKDWFIKKIGGFVTTDDFIEKVKELPMDDKYKILNLAVKKLFNTVSSEDLLKQTESGEWIVDGRPLVKGEYDNIIGQAKSFRESTLFKILDKEVKYHGNKKMREATTLFQLESAKMLEYVWDILKTRLKKM